MLAVLAVLVMMCGGCAAPEVDWHGDARFSADERAAIEAGEAWIAQHAGRQPATFDWTYNVTSEYPLDHTIRRERGPLSDGTTASGLCWRTTMYLDLADANPEAREGLAAHEMAHCELGFVDGYHPSDPPTDGIMRVLFPMRWTAAEDAQLAKTDAR